MSFRLFFVPLVCYIPTQATPKSNRNYCLPGLFWSVEKWNVHFISFFYESGSLNFKSI